jgi:hypothetical protein
MATGGAAQIIVPYLFRKIDALRMKLGLSAEGFTDVYQMNWLCKRARLKLREGN